MTDRTGTAPNPHAAQVLKLADAMLRGALWPGLGTVVIGAVVATVWVGVPGLLGALVGGAVAFASSLASLWMMRRTSGMDPMALLAVALGGYIVKFLVLLGVMMLLGGVEALHPFALALTMLAVILVWATAEAIAFKRTKIPTIIPDSSGQATAPVDNSPAEGR
ncbi:hypothetical protein B0I33_103257 [Prauserella shujinwangii]|uniref:ATP synthase protein I n=1 Tax=Prauserella shujinwangii TaxID=1453103 RepID=A0A2T0LYN1_9PSEU|nr:hypothetical protein [Prauserella shujinwangii]PRX49223.1 hypothetical protein B0I33_103257 [Prauserella shujinwangii]